MIIRTLPALAALLGFGVCQASINWSSTVGTALRDIDATPLFAGTSTTGFFVQLIRDVNGDGISPVNTANANGQGGDDVVVDVSFFGSFSAAGGVVNGQLNPQSTGEPHVQGASYYIRFWNAKSRQVTAVGLGAGNESTPIPDFDLVTGINPLTGNPLRYGNSEVILIPDAITANIAAAFSGPSTSKFTTDITLVNTVPEPTTAALLSMGVAGIGMALKRRRQNS